MSVNYSSSVFFGIVLDIGIEAFYEIYEGDWDHNGEVCIEMMGNAMSGPEIPVAYLRSSYIELGSESSFFGVENLNSVTAAQGYEIYRVLDSFGINTKGVIGWKAANNVS